VELPKRLGRAKRATVTEGATNSRDAVTCEVRAFREARTVHAKAGDDYYQTVPNPNA
jgi:hypothetical protein